VKLCFASVTPSPDSEPVIFEFTLISSFKK
jgi:hypothetical protein